MSDKWQRNVPVFNVPILTRPFVVLCALAGLGLVLAAYREVFGLGPSTGMNDTYAWGIWKTFNTMVLTGLGSGAFAIGIAAWVFRREQLHVVMRTALLTSFLAYICGLAMLGVDVGRPWNFYWILFPWRWNLHSPLLEVAVCMSFYATIPLFLENIPAVLDYFYDHRPGFRPNIEKIEKIFVVGYPFVVALAYVLPAMHQSSLGALMLLGGARVHPLWQTPFLPLLYVWAAAFLGFAFVSVTLLSCGIAWRRPLDIDILGELSRITTWLIGSWLVFRIADLTVRGQIVSAFRVNIFATLFWVEMALLAFSVWVLRSSVIKRNPRKMFYGALLAMAGGMLYRFDPTTTAFSPKAGAVYFPSVIELLISLGFVSIAVASFIFLAKVLPILPAPAWMSHAIEAQPPGSPSIPASALHPAGKQYVAGD
jgi:Ni/Fe-hydrogenase subunit HybB-like protein